MSMPLVTHLAKHDVLSIEEIGRLGRNKELTPVGVGARVGLGKQAVGDVPC